MATYLLNWNPNRWDWFELEEEIAILEEEGWLNSRWSCGVTKRIKPGDRFFLMRLGKAPKGTPKGIMGSGWITSEPFDELHWEDELADSGRSARFVDIVFDSLLNSDFEQILELDYLREHPILSQMNWLQQASGVQIPERVAEELQREWSDFLTVSVPPPSNTPSEGERFIEGRVKEIHSTIYERNAAARKACLDHYGFACAVCGFDFKVFYGSIGEGLIHVHHLLPLAEINGEYELDPVKDLRPVCANCHAIIHRRKPIFSIDEVKELILINQK